MLDDYTNQHFIKENGENDITTCVIRNSNAVKNSFLDRIDDKTKVTVVDGVVFYPKDYFSPKDYETGEIVLTENSCAIHHFSASWHTKEDIEKAKRYKKKLSKYIARYGEERGKIIFDKKERLKFYICHPRQLFQWIRKRLKGGKEWGLVLLFLYIM